MDGTTTVTVSPGAAGEGEVNRERAADAVGAAAHEVEAGGAAAAGLCGERGGRGRARG
jgi:hypothetical protein